MNHKMQFLTVGITSFFVVLGGLFLPGNPMREKTITRDEAYNRCLVDDKWQYMSETEIRSECYDRYTETF